MRSYIDHTILKATTTVNDIKRICAEAVENRFYTVCLSPCYVKMAKTYLLNTDVLVCTVIGFPLGANKTEVKVFETAQAIKDGADEIDMVLNIGYLKNGQYDFVLNDIKEVKKVCGNKVLKVIIETCYLTDKEIIKASQLIEEANADFVKTSTGFAATGATIEDVKLIRSSISNKVKIKASGGIKTNADLVEMVNAGASRIGTSNGIALIKGKKSNSNY